MNAPFDPPSTMARHSFTLDDVLELQAQGLVDQRSQLLDGDIYDMPSDGHRHQKYAMGIAQLFMAKLFGQPNFIGVQTTLRLSKHNAPSPDIYVLGGSLPDDEVEPDEVLLVIEVADTSLKDNLTSSAARYARHGIREYWVVDVATPCIYVHRDPVNGAYPQPRRAGASESLTPLRVGQVTVRLTDFA